jgi:3-oxoacyl-[acyl-carrier-protein] synthase II
MKKRVVITGLGVVSPLGIGKDIFWSNLIAGKSGITDVTLFDTSLFKRHRAGEVQGFDSLDYIPKEIIKFIPRASQFASVAVKLALKDANFRLTDIRTKNSALLIGTTMADARAYDFVSKIFIKEEWGNIFERLLMHTFSSSIPRNVGHFLKIKGTNVLIPTACAAANYSLAYGFDLIRKREVDVAIIGGSDSLSRIAFQGFHRLYAMSPDKCSPFDKNRKGMMLGEGSGVLILESLESAKKRGARIYAEVLGYGLSCDAHHMTIPKKEGVKKAMRKALKNSGIKPKDIDYISAHGTGTIANDKNETEAIKNVFNNKKVAVSSIKSMLGHCMGAASGLESIACCLAIKEGVLPPTINFETPDPECDVDCVPNKARNQEVNTVLNNGFAFGGNNCCVVLTDVN